MKTFVKKSTYEKVMAMERTKRRNPLRPVFLIQILIRILSMFDLIPANSPMRPTAWKKSARKSLV